MRKFLTILSALLILIMFFATNRLHAQNAVPDCTKDSGSPDYCGETAPFRGCVGGVGGNEWLCMCRLKSGKWWSECSIIEDSAGKQKYIDKCGGDKEKAFMQWKYDIAIMETSGECSCDGQNVCGSLVPTPRPKEPEGGTQITDIPEPTVDYHPFVPPITQTSRQKGQTGSSKQIPFQTNSSPRFDNSIKEQSTQPPEQTVSLNLPHLEINLSRVNTFVRKPMSYVESLFQLITLYDARLENFINTIITRSIK